MNIHGLQVSSSSLRDSLRLERSLQHLAKKEEATFDLAIACFVLVFKMQFVFSRCGFPKAGELESLNTKQQISVVLFLSAIFVVVFICYNNRYTQINKYSR